MTNETLNYLTILQTMINELNQPVPMRHVLENCRMFIVEAPLPSVQLYGVTEETVWGGA